MKNIQKVIEKLDYKKKEAEFYLAALFLGESKISDLAQKLKIPRTSARMALLKKPDLILLDILMPVMDGLTMMDKLRKKNQYGKNVPIVLLSNLSSSEEKIMKTVTNTKNEPTSYFVKSDWDLDEVVEKIKELLHT